MILRDGRPMKNEKVMLLVLKDKIKINNRMAPVTLCATPMAFPYLKLTYSLYELLADGYFLSKMPVWIQTPQETTYQRSEKPFLLITTNNGSSWTCGGTTDFKDNAVKVVAGCIRQVDPKRPVLLFPLYIGSPIMHRYGTIGFFLGLEQHLIDSGSKMRDISFRLYHSSLLNRVIIDLIRRHFPNKRQPYKPKYVVEHDVVTEKQEVVEEANYFYPEIDMELKKIMCSYDYMDGGNCESFIFVFVVIIFAVFYRLFF